MTSKRTINASNETALLSSVVRPVLFARLDFPSGVQRYHTNVGPITATHPVHGSEVYTGLGDFGGLQSEVVENTVRASSQVALTITGVKASITNLTLTDNYYRRDADVLIGLLNESHALIADPEYLFAGLMEKVDISLREGIGQITLTVESRGAKFQRASDLRFTDEDKQRETSGDLLAEYVYRMNDLELFWGDRAFVSPFAPPAGPPPAPGPGRQFR